MLLTVIQMTLCFYQKKPNHKHVTFIKINVHHHLLILLLIYAIRFYRTGVKKKYRLTCMKVLIRMNQPQYPLNFQKGSYLVNHFTATVVIHNGTRLKSD